MEWEETASTSQTKEGTFCFLLVVHPHPSMRPAGHKQRPQKGSNLRRLRDGQECYHYTMQALDVCLLVGRDVRLKYIYAVNKGGSRDPLARRLFAPGEGG